MGNIFSSALSSEDIKDLQIETAFSVHEIELLYQRFCYLDRLGLGYITYKELNTIPEFEMNPFNKLICHSIETRMKYTNITFSHFVDLIRIFHFEEHKKERLDFLFSIFDLNKDGRICKSVLKRIYNTIGCDNDKEVNTVLRMYDTDKKGYMDYKDFCTFYNGDDSLDKNMINAYNVCVE